MEPKGKPFSTHLTPITKAFNIVKEYVDIIGGMNNFQKAIYCATESVQEIIELDVLDWTNEEELRYWEQVKEEIDKL